jgi:hypothetical protein
MAEGSIESSLFTLPMFSNRKSFKIVKAPPRKIIDVEDVRLKLSRYLEPNSEPLPLTGVADCIGYDGKILRREFPEMCKQISQRYLSNRTKVSQKKHGDFIDEITSAVFHLHSSGQPITRELIADCLNKPAYKNNPSIGGPMREAKRKLK